MTALIVGDETEAGPAAVNARAAAARTPISDAPPDRPMSDLAKIVAFGLGAAQGRDHPWRHWRLDNVLAADVCRKICSLPVPLPPAPSPGKREGVNDSRLFLAPPLQEAFPVCAAVAGAFRSACVTKAIERLCGIELGGSLLRIEYCRDQDGFWLEPHTDIGAKLLTLLIYLSEDGSPDWGTDLMTSSGEVVETAPYRFNTGLLFLPSQDTWHGFHPRPLNGLRRSLIVNYVKDEWRSRHELAFPDPL